MVKFKEQNKCPPRAKSRKTNQIYANVHRCLEAKYVESSYSIAMCAFSFLTLIFLPIILYPKRAAESVHLFGRISSTSRTALYRGMRLSFQKNFHYSEEILSGTEIAAWNVLYKVAMFDFTRGFY